MGREEEEIAEGIRELFKETNPNSITSLNDDVILPLQSKLPFDLSPHLHFIRAHITLLFTPHQHTLVGPTPPPPQHHHPHPISHSHSHSQSQQPHHVYHPHPVPQHSHFGAGFGVAVGVGPGGGRVGPTQISFGGGGDVEHVMPKESPQARPKRRGGPGGLNKLCGVSPLLQTIVGQPAMPRTEIVKQLWAYIRKHNLQDPSNKRKIICNDELRLVFETDSTDMFQMNKLLAKHIVPLDTTKDPGQQSKKLKVEDSQVPSTEPSPVPSPAPAPAPAPSPARAPSAPAPSAPVSTAPVPLAAAVGPAPIVISEALANFFGISEKEMLQSEVYKRMEEYIKAEGLEDPLNSMIICDTKLQELLGCESVSTPGFREALARNHLFQRA